MRRTTTAIVAAGLLGMAGWSHAVMIDSYNFGGGTLNSIGPGGSGTDSSTAAEIIGGTRTLSIPGSEPVDGGNLSFSANEFDSGELRFSLGAGASGSAVITWDADGAGLNGLDLSDGGPSTFITFNILAIDQGFVELRMTVEDTVGSTGFLEILNAVAGIQQFTFDDFSGSVDFTMANLISLEITGTDASDLSMGEIFTSGPLDAVPVVPEPGSVGLIALAGLALLRLRRRGRAAA